MSTAAAELDAFAAWWLHEVREAWIAASERLVPKRSQHFVIESGPGGELPPVEQICPQGAPARARATIVLPESSILACELRLPPVAERDIARAVELQLERKLPLPRDQLYVDWRVRGTLADRSRLIEIVMARRKTVDRVREGVRAWGWRPVAVTRKESDDRQRCNLLPAPSRRLSFAIGKRERYLAWSAAALLGVSAVVALGQALLDRTTLSDDLDQARAQMASIETQRAALATDGKPIAMLHDLMARPSAAEGLIAVSNALPRDSWIYQADIRAVAGGVSLHLEGYTPSSTALLQGLERSGGLDSIELIEATNAGIGAGTERIELKARMRGGAQP